VPSPASRRSPSLLFGKAKDPTADWPAAGQAPTLDLQRHAIGPLCLGDPLENARALGQPKRFRDGYLQYETFELEFKDGRLVAVKFDIDEGSSVNVAGDIRLSRAVKPLDVQTWFGEPVSDSTGGGNLRWIDFEHDAATLALEFTAERLTCVQLYAEGYA
jgi:hypothetical protein